MSGRLLPKLSKGSIRWAWPKIKFQRRLAIMADEVTNFTVLMILIAVDESFHS